MNIFQQGDKFISATISSSMIISKKKLTNYNHIHQSSVLISISYQYTIQLNNLFLIIYPSTKKWTGSTENITVSTEFTTIHSSPSKFVSKDYFGNTLQATISQYSYQPKELNHLGEKQLE